MAKKDKWEPMEVDEVGGERVEGVSEENVDSEKNGEEHSKQKKQEELDKEKNDKEKLLYCVKILRMMTNTAANPKTAFEECAELLKIVSTRSVSTRDQLNEKVKYWAELFRIGSKQAAYVRERVLDKGVIIDTEFLRILCISMNGNRNAVEWSGGPICYQNELNENAIKMNKDGTYRHTLLLTVENYVSKINKTHDVFQVSFRRVPSYDERIDCDMLAKACYELIPELMEGGGGHPYAAGAQVTKDDVIADWNNDMENEILVYLKKRLTCVAIEILVEPENKRSVYKVYKENLLSPGVFTCNSLV